MRRHVYVISDLHLGGEPPSPADASGRGFRMCSRSSALARFIASLSSIEGSEVELVINGDAIDFLAEPRAVPTRPDGGVGWSPLIEDAAEAVRVFERVARREAAVFQELREFLARGNRLTILLGNHDLELAYPAVRRELHRVLAADGRRLQFLYDGEAYAIGDLVVEHGNCYDVWNVVDHDGLRRVRSLQSRKETPDDCFVAPAGSHLVASVINRIKERFPFIDLLKPENEVVVPLLLALAPEYGRHVVDVAALAARAYWGRYGGLLQGASAGNISSGGTPGGYEWLVDQLAGELTPREARQLLGDPPTPALSVLESNISVADKAMSAWALLLLLGVPRSSPLATRIDKLELALRAARGGFDFRRDRERQCYEEAARSLFQKGFRVVVFGHTHLAKDIRHPDGKVYLNTGTWADLMRLPDDLWAPTGSVDTKALELFLDDLEQSRLERHIRFTPTFARVVLDAHDRVQEAALEEWP